MPNTIGTRPLILAFDTSAAHCAAALLMGDDVIQSAVEPMAKGQAERLLVLCTELMDKAGLAVADLTAIGVGVGPGNFTGIRISVSAARGLALGLGIPAVGVSNFDALRFGTTGPCACTVAARRDMVYLQGYENADLSEPSQYPAADLPVFNGPLIGAGGQAPVHSIAEAIARITATRHFSEITRPAPLYLRAADAAPGRDAAPVILP